MALDADDARLVAALTQQLHAQADRCARMDAYYDGVQTLEQMGLAVPPDLRRFTTIVAWPQLAVDSVEERLDVEGFRDPGEEDSDEQLWDVWQANDLDEMSQLAHLDGLLYGSSYVSVGANDTRGDPPVVAVEPTGEVTVTRDPRTRRVTAGLRLYDPPTDDLGNPMGEPRQATLYQPDATVWLARASGQWAEVDRDDHRLGVVPLVPLTNRPRTRRRDGVSDVDAVIGLTDAAARSLTNLQLAQETHAVPQRYALGASKGDFVDAEGNVLPVWAAYFGAVWALENEDAKVGQFSASDLRNFTETIAFYARLIGGLTGLPPAYLGLATDNPASADAIRAAEARLVKRAERKQRSFSGSWEQVMRLVRRIQSGSWDSAGARIETLWRDPATPTKSQQADAVVKLVAAGVLPREAAWEDLGYSAQRRERLRSQYQSQATDGVAADLAAIGAVPMPSSDDDAQSLKAKADALGVLVRAGVEPDDAARLAGLPVDFTGAVPTSLRVKETDAAALED